MTLRPLSRKARTSALVSLALVFTLCWALASTSNVGLRPTSKRKPPLAKKLKPRARVQSVQGHALSREVSGATAAPLFALEGTSREVAVSRALPPSPLESISREIAVAVNPPFNSEAVGREVSAVVVSSAALDALSREVSATVRPMTNTEAIGREVSLAIVATTATDALSREISASAAARTTFVDAISREVAGGLLNPAIAGGAVSREVAIGPTSVATLTESFSREISGNVPRPEPNLTVSRLQVPATLYTDRAFEVIWTDFNKGSDPALGAWTDRVLLSRTPSPEGATTLADYPISGPLAPASQLDRAQFLTLARSQISEDGDYYLIVYSDAGNAVAEPSNEDDNWRAVPIHVVRTPYPDLVVDSIDAPSAANSGQTIEVRYVVKNAGQASTDASEWTDWVYLSPDGRPAIENPVKIPVANVSYLDAGESYVATARLTIPRNLAGAYKLVVYTDFDGTNHLNQVFNVVETDETNNYTVVRPIQIALSPVPDLNPTRLSVPAEAFTGSTMPLNWRVQNDGAAAIPPAERSWNDRVYLSKDRTLDASDRDLGTIYPGRAMNVGEFYDAALTANVPTDVAGDWFVILRVDASDNVFELGGEENNVRVSTAAVHIKATPPDLIVQSLTLPSNAKGDDLLEVHWRVKNQGAFPAQGRSGGWTDTVYLSKNPTFDLAASTAMASVRHTTDLDAGLSYDATTTFRMPVCNDGAYYAYLVTDAGNEVFEYDPNLDAESNNTSEARNLDVVKNASNLTVAAVRAPVSVQAGTTVTVGWTIRNSGSGATNAAGWNDSVYLSPTPNAVGGVLLGQIGHTGKLAAGDTYEATASFPVPLSLDGTYYVVVQTDSGNAVEECDDEGDNAHGDGVINVQNSTPDLTAAWTAAPATGRSGATIALTWRDTNGGVVAIGAGVSWLDSVYLSTDPILDPSDRPLGQAIARGPLTPGTGMGVGTSVTLPGLAEGDYYLLVKTDSLNSIFEGRHEENNVASRVIRISPPATDLIVSAVDGPPEALANGEMTVSWTVKNAGAEATFANAWTDYVILSRDAILDPTDRPIGHRLHTGVLAGGDSYVASVKVDVPAGLSGPYYVFVRTDWFDQVAENEELNNFGYDPEAVMMTLPPPTDLVVASIAAPSSGSPGETSTLTWTVKNIGSNPAPGRWQDAVYLSKDGVWDIDDVLVGRVDHVGDLPSGESYTGTLEAELPAVSPGSYRVIVRTDVKNRVRESDEKNNSTASATTIAIDIQELTLGVPRQSSLTQGKQRYYKVRVPAGETLRHTLDSVATDDINSLFVRFGGVANLSAYDFTGQSFFSPDQVVTAPNTLAGWYFSLARGEFVQNSPSPFSILAELVPFSLSSVYPSRIGAGEVTVRLTGGRLFELSDVNLTTSKGETIDSSWLRRNQQGEIFATFQLAGADLGVANINITSNKGVRFILPRAVTIEAPQSPNLRLYSATTSPAAVGKRVSNFYSVTNDSNVDAPMGLLNFTVAPIGGLYWRVRSEFETEGVSSDEYALANEKNFDRFFLPSMGPHSSLGYSIDMKMTLGGVSKTPIAASVMAITRNDFIAAEVNPFASQLRPLVLQFPNEFEPRLALAATNEATFRQVVEDILQEAGVLGFRQEDLGLFAGVGSGFHRYTTNGIAGDYINQLPCAVVCKILGQKVTGLLASNGFSFICKRYCKKIQDWVLDLCNYESRELVKMCIRPNDYIIVGCGESCFTSYPGNTESGCFLRITQYRCPEWFQPRDPNDKLGPLGYGPEKFVSVQQPSSYTIDFENVATASAAARRVVVEDQLDSSLDGRTFRLKEIGIGKLVIPVPANRAFFQTRVSLGESMGNMLADVSAGIDVATGKIRVVLTAIDPTTGEEPDGALQGLLLPNDESGRGQGYVTYTVAPRAGTPTGQVVSNSATIVFDQEAPLTTNTVTNTVDGFAPATHVQPLPATSTAPAFVVNWSGADDSNGSGLQSFDIYVDTDGGGYVPWLQSTTDTSGTYAGEYGHTYSFYSVGHDNAGNAEGAPETPDATVVVGPYPRPTLISAAPNALSVGGSAATITVKGTGFAPKTVALVGNSARTTGFVSATELKVTLTAADLARAATLNLTAANPTPGGGTSNALLLSVGSAVRIAPSVTLVRDGTNFVARIRLTNSGTGEASGLAVSTGLLTGRTSLTSLPVTVGDIAAGASKELVLTFAANGSAGAATTFRVAGRYNGGTFDATLRVTLP